MGGRRIVIKVSGWVKEQLDRIKERNGHTSYDSVIRYLLWKSGELGLEGEAKGHTSGGGSRA